MTELERLLAEWLASPYDNIKKSIGEKIGELCADIKVKEMYAGRIKKVLVIPRRGEKGAVILDIAYELDKDEVLLIESKFNTAKKGKVYQNIFEADDVTGTGAVETIKLEDQVTQLEGPWLQDRITEIRRQDNRLANKLSTAWEKSKLRVHEINTVPEVANGKATIKEISVKDETENLNKFKQGIHQQITDKERGLRDIAKKEANNRKAANEAKDRAKKLRGEAETAKKDAERLREKANKAKENVKNFKKESTRSEKEKLAKEADDVAKNAEHNSAKVNQAATQAEIEAKQLNNVVESLDKESIKQVQARAISLNNEAQNAEKKAARLRDKATKAKENINNFKKESTRKEKAKLAQEADITAGKAESEAVKARQAAVNADIEAKQLTKINSKGTASTATEAKLTEASAKDIITEKQPIKASTAVDVGSANTKAIHAKDIEKRGTDLKGIKGEISTTAKADKAVETGSKVSSAIEILETGEKVAAKAGKAKFVVKLAFSGAKVIGKIGKFIFTFMDVTGLNLLGDLLLLVDVVDFVVDWINRKEIERRKEWKRLIAFLFGENKSIKGLFNISYQTSIQPAILSIAEFKLRDTNYQKNYLYWLNKWNSDSGWQGFVYTVVNVSLERQVRLQSDNDEDYNTKYYLNGAINISFTDAPVENKFTQKFVGTFGPMDERNYATQGRQPPYSDPKYNYGVETNELDVSYTQPIPYLTPLDFIIVKCRILFSSIIGFIAKYDPIISKDTDTFIDENFIEEFLNNDIFKGYEFKRPLNNENIHYSLAFIFWTIKYLSSHSGVEDDFVIDKNRHYNNGMFRRQQILFKLSRPLIDNKTNKKLTNTSPFDDLRGKLLNIINNETKSDLIKPIDKELQNLTDDYLSNFASEIDDDIKRVFEDTKKRPYAYQYTGAKPD